MPCRPVDRRFFLTRPSLREATELPCKGLRSLSRHPREDLTSGCHFDAFEPTCSTSTAQLLNPLPLADVSARWSLRCVLHQGRNASVYLGAIPFLFHSKHCSKETGTKSRQDHPSFHPDVFSQVWERALLHPPKAGVPLGLGFIRLNIRLRGGRSAIPLPGCQSG